MDIPRKIFVLNKSSITKEAITFEHEPCPGTGVGPSLGIDSKSGIFLLEKMMHAQADEIERSGVWTKNAIKLGKELLNQHEVTEESRNAILNHQYRYTQA